MWLGEGAEDKRVSIQVEGVDGMGGGEMLKFAYSLVKCTVNFANVM